jgi:hypothetical protein
MDELTTLVQVLELYGKGAGALGRAIKFTAKVAKTGVDFLEKLDYKIGRYEIAQETGVLTWE